MIKVFSYFLLVVCIASCQSKVAEQRRSSSDTLLPAKAAVSPANFKFSLHISGSGMRQKPFDAFTMDTNGMMTVLVSRRLPTGKFQDLHAMAQIEPRDYDTLRMIVMKGNLFEIDSSDVTQVCAESELYHLDIVPLHGKKASILSFSGCAADYNLLLEPQRKYFRMLIDWWERMRPKYRPSLPE